jgi:hypothetical protein
MSMKKPVVVDGISIAAPAERCKLTSGWKSLWDHLTETKWDDGSERTPSTLLVFYSDGCWKACLNDKSMGRTGWISSATLSGLLRTLDEALEAEKLDWRKSTPPAGRGGKKWS